MSMTDPVSDYLTRIRNATMRRHRVVENPSSKLKQEMSKVLKKEGFIEDWEVFENEQGKPCLRLHLKYGPRGEVVVRGLKRISKPGLRRHAGWEEISPVLNGQGIRIVSTSKGLLTDFECRQAKVGGEILCTVW